MPAKVRVAAEAYSPSSTAGTDSLDHSCRKYTGNIRCARNRVRRNCALHTECADYTPTPDRLYFVVRGRLWRLSSPWPNPAIHARPVQKLVAARRAVRDAPDSKERIGTRLKVDAASELAANT
jgi:hypothetical protein